MKAAKKSYIFSQIAILMVVMFVTPSVASAELTVQSVNPAIGITGQDLECKITGTGFDENTRVLMYRDKAVIGRAYTPGIATRVAVSGTIAYVADGSGGLQIIDIGNPTKPQRISSVATNCSAYGLAFSDSKVYLAVNGISSCNRLEIIDVSDSYKPVKISSVKLADSGGVSDVAVADNKAYITAGESGLIIIDVSDPLAPVRIGSVDTPGQAADVTVKGNTAFVGDADGGLQIIDISDPADSRIISSVAMPDLVGEVFVRDQIVYAACGNSGLQVIDISNISAPRIIASADTPGTAAFITVSDNIAFVGEFMGKLQIIDIENPFKPRIIRSLSASIMGTGGSEVVGDMAYTADGYGGLMVVSAPIEVPVTVNSNTDMSLTLPGTALAGSYTLCILNDSEKFEKTAAVSFITQISPAAYHFGRIQSGKASQAQTFTFSNTLGDSAIEIGTVAIAGEDSSDFSIRADGCSGKILNPLDQCHVEVAFSPKSGEEKKASLFIPLQNSEQLLSAELIGIGYEENESYRFERSWPTLQQPWYFNSPYGIAGDKNGFVYICDSESHCIYKLTSDGQFVSVWGKYGVGDGEFNSPLDITVDSNNVLYVSDTGNSRIQKFSSEGSFLGKWTGKEFIPAGIAADSKDSIYVSDIVHNQICKFDSDGKLEFKFGTYGNGNGEFSSPIDVAVDEDGFIYVTDKGNSRVQKFNSEGKFSIQWKTGIGDKKFGEPFALAVSGGFVYVADEGDGVQKFTSEGVLAAQWEDDERDRFRFSHGIMTDKEGYVYVTDSGIRYVQKFDSAGNLIAQWGSRGNKNGLLSMPEGMAADSNGFIYVADMKNDRIQKFSPDGQFLAAWGNNGIGDKEFYLPYHLTLDDKGFVYVADTGNCRVQKFDSSGNFIAKWGNRGSGNGEFSKPLGIAVDRNDYVYVSDADTHRIQKFTSDGQFVSQWGMSGSGDGAFNFPSGIAVDSAAYLYVADSNNHRIQKFSSDGQFVTKWGSIGSRDGEFDSPADVAVDTEGFVYVADKNNHRVQKFTSEGLFITAFGESGSGTGQLIFPEGLCVSPEGKIYVSDGYSRIQVFKKAVWTGGKAIIAAGRKAQDDLLWDATQLNANFAYRTLNYQGFSKHEIRYLSSNTGFDLDNNGQADDVIAATSDNLKEAITIWAKGADNLTLYLVDHGGDNSFQIAENEAVSGTELNSWLLQAGIPGKTIIVYDACSSGSFLYSLRSSDKKRTVISSADISEPASFISQGVISFSSYFWTHIFNGLDVKEAFSRSSEAMKKFQNPLLDADGDGKGNESEDLPAVKSIYIGNGTMIRGEAPVIGSVSPEQTVRGISSASIKAFDVSDSDGIVSVWAVILPPNYNQQMLDGTVQGLPSLILNSAGTNQYEGSYEEFNIPGTYQIAVYARDSIGNISSPKLTAVNVENPLRRRAVIVAGGSPSDLLWTAIGKSLRSAYHALKIQSYSDEDIYLLSAAAISDIPKTPVLPTLKNFEYALTVWGRENTQDLTLYMIGKGFDGAFSLSPEETLTDIRLDNWLDELQNNLSGKVAVIYDACRSGSFIPSLTAPEGKERIVVCSADDSQPACFSSDGDVSFSNFFWQEVSNGSDSYRAYAHALDAVEFSGGQTPMVSSKELARKYVIGSGIMLASDEPVIGAVSPEQTLKEETSAAIWAEGITSLGMLYKVWAVIAPPGTDTAETDDPATACELNLPVLLLKDTGTGRYEGTYPNFTDNGTYQIAVYAMDKKGNISRSLSSRIKKSAPDTYESDNTFETAKVIVMNGSAESPHNFYQANDEDWVKFYGLSGQNYSINVSNAGAKCDAVIELYDENKTLLKERNTYESGENELLSWPCSKDGIYYIKIRNSDSAVFGEDTEYKLTISSSVGPQDGKIEGIVTDACSKSAVRDVKIRTAHGESALIFENGTYTMPCSPGDISLIADAPGYETFSCSVTLAESAVVTQNITMTPTVKGVEVCNGRDDDCDGQIDEDVKKIYYDDADGDKFGNPNDSIQACGAPDGYAEDKTDCNDADASIHPNAAETCNGKDDDCDGQIDEDVKKTYYHDADGDKFGNPNETVQACNAPDGYVEDKTDCNDADASIHPNALETCNSKDDDCDNQIDEDVKKSYYRDTDGDKFGNPNESVQACTPPDGYVENNTDCNDDDKDEYPGQVWYKDTDKDGYSDGMKNETSCTRPEGHKLVSELKSVSGDCDDVEILVHPDAPETCNYRDDDCDGQIDEDVKNTFYEDADNDGYGNPNKSTEDCTQPKGYVTDNTDTDDTDPNVPCSHQVWYKDADNDGYSDGTKDDTSCVRPEAYKLESELKAVAGDCDDSDPNIYPQIWYKDADGDGHGNPNETVEACSPPEGYVADNTDCNDNNACIPYHCKVNNDNSSTCTLDLCEVNLTDAITALKILTGMEITPDIPDINCEGKIGFPEVIYILKNLSE